MKYLTTAIAGVFIAFLNCSSYQVWAYEPPYNANNARDYLLARENIFVGVKLEGGLGIGEFINLASKYASESEVRALESKLQDEIAPYKYHKFIALKVFKGGLEPVVDIPQRYVSESQTSIGKTYLLFLDTDTFSSLDICTVFPVELFPEGFLKENGTEQVVSYILDNDLSICTK